MNKNLLKCFYTAMFGNICFIFFGIVCYIYYQAFGRIGLIVRSIEAVAYLFEGSGFVLNLISIIFLFKTVRQRFLMKYGYCFYILAELIMMVMELNSHKLSFYNPYSMALSIVHAVISALVCFMFLQLEPKTTCLEVMVIVSVAIMFFGMMGTLFGVRIYFSIITNAFAYVVLFASVIFFLKQERLEIDCYGDKATTVKYKSSFFEE